MSERIWSIYLLYDDDRMVAVRWSTECAVDMVVEGLIDWNVLPYPDYVSKRGG